MENDREGYYEGISGSIPRLGINHVLGNGKYRD